MEYWSIGVMEWWGDEDFRLKIAERQKAQGSRPKDFELRIADLGIRKLENWRIRELVDSFKSLKAFTRLTVYCLPLTAYCSPKF